MSIDVDRNRNFILKAFNDVVSDKTNTDWALFGYEGQTNVLKVVATGEDGLEELAEDLNSSKIMYAVVRVTDPNTSRFKIVLINWQGEGAPTLRKGTCARHLADVHKLLRGVHVTVNARTEEEVEPEFVMAAVLKASATTYNFSDRSDMNDKTTPVGTNYKRINPLAEIDSKSRNKFWEEQEAEEKNRKAEEQQKKDEELKKLESERRQREIVDFQQREKLTKERNARIMAERKAEEAAAQRCAQKGDPKWQQELENQQMEENERGKRAEIMRLERKKEAEALIGQRTHSTRAIFECGSSGGSSHLSSQERDRPPPRKLKEFISVREDNESTASTVNKGVVSRWPPAVESSHQQSTPAQQGGNLMPSSNVGRPVQTLLPFPASPSGAPIKQPHESPKQQMNGNTDSAVYDTTIKTSSQDYQQNITEDCSFKTDDASTNGAPKTDAAYDKTVQSSSGGTLQHVETPGIGMIYEVEGVEYQILPEHGLCARALYDYQAADDSEITFDPSEIITNIDQIDEGWWQGIGPDGMFGLFPANYVELINQPPV